MDLAWLLIVLFGLLGGRLLWVLHGRASVWLIRQGAVGPVTCRMNLTVFPSKSWGPAEVFILPDALYVRRRPWDTGYVLVRSEGVRKMLGKPLLSTLGIVKRVEFEGDSVNISFRGFVSGRMTLTELSGRDREHLMRAMSEAHAGGPA